MVLPPPASARMQHITLGSLAILERLGNPCLPFLLGTAPETERWTDHIDGIAEVLFLHLPDTDLSEVVTSLLESPALVRERALQWACTVDETEAAGLLVELLEESRRVRASMVEPVKKTVSGRKNA